jgi:hypothetical protein
LQIIRIEEECSLEGGYRLLIPPHPIIGFARYRQVKKRAVQVETQRLLYIT